MRAVILIILALSSFVYAGEAPTDQEAKAYLEEMRRAKAEQIKAAEKQLQALRLELSKLANVSLAEIKKQIVAERAAAAAKSAEEEKSRVWYDPKDKSPEKREEWDRKIPLASEVVAVLQGMTLKEAERRMFAKFSADIISGEYTSYRLMTPRYEVVLKVDNRTTLVTAATAYPR